MSIPNTRVMKPRPTHRGEMLREDFMPDYALTVAGLVQALAVSRQSINELLRERRALSLEMALRLSRLFGNAPEFWLNAQRSVDLWEAGQAIKDDVARIKPLRVAQQTVAPVSRAIVRRTKLAAVAQHQFERRCPSPDDAHEPVPCGTCRRELTDGSPSWDLSR